MAALELIARSNKESRVASLDRISHLPPDVMDNILRFLPLKDVVRMSILSAHWRYKWAYLPQLLLDTFFFSGFPKLKKSMNTRGTSVGEIYSTMVDHILLRHVGPIHKFVLHFPRNFPEDADISRWIQFFFFFFFGGKQVKDLTLRQESTLCRNRKLPSYLFTCVGFNSLTHLVLEFCSLMSLPSTFRGFPCVISLKVNIIYASKSEDDQLGMLVSKCPLLEILSLGVLFFRSYREEACLNIHAPKLQDLSPNGYLSSIYLEETKQIKNLSLQVSWNQKSNPKIEFFSCFPNVEELHLGGGFWLTNWLKEVGCPKKFNFPGEFRQLKHLMLYSIPIHYQWAISFILCLFQTTPNLLKLEINANVCDTVEPCIDDMIVVDDCCLCHLKVQNSAFGCVGQGLCYNL